MNASRAAKLLCADCGAPMDQVDAVAVLASLQEHSIVGNLVGSWIDLWELLQLQAAGRLTLKTETHSLDSVNDVLDKLREGEVTGRAVLVPA